MAADEQPLQRNEIRMYEHDSFQNKGRIVSFIVTEKASGVFHSLHTMHFKDCLSSLKFNLDPGLVVTFHEDHEGGGRQLPVSGTGEIKNTKDRDFKDCASSFLWSSTKP